MKSFRRAVPSPSMAIALIALFVALGGTAWAAAKINGKNLKNRSVAAAKIKKNSLGANEIRESSIAPKLPTVPSANQANQATNASRADVAGALDGLAKFNVRVPVNTPESDVFNTGKLRVTTQCDGAGAVTVRAYTSVDNASIIAYGTSSDTNDDDFDIADSPLTISASDEERDYMYAEPGGQVVAIQAITAEQAGLASGGCLFAGFYMAK